MLNMLCIWNFHVANKKFILENPFTVRVMRMCRNEKKLLLNENDAYMLKHL